MGKLNRSSGKRRDDVRGSASRAGAFALVVLALLFGGCGGEHQVEPTQTGTPDARATESAPGEDSDTATAESRVGAEKTGDAALARRPAGIEGLRVPAKRARIVARESRFGLVLFDANGQVVYVFEKDRPNRSNCTSGECVKAWPPVLTRQRPSAGAGVDEGLLATIRRGDGMLQVTYDSRPLYFYEHEGPGEIKCHNVNLHGGLWWVVTPRGSPAA